MAKVRQFVWKIPGHRTKRKAWGFVAMRDGKQFRMFKSEWNREHAEEALAEFKLNIETPKAPVSITFAEAVERYVAAKARKKGLTEDRRILGHLGAFLGNDTPLTEITASRISEYKAHRLQTARKIGDGTRLLAGGTVNRALAALRHLLRLAHEEWEVLPAVPRIRLERESEGRLRWLTPEDAVRLLDACRASRNVDLLDLVELALFTGMRRGELLGLTWERVDRGRGVILLDGTSTKSKRRREVPLNGRADAVLARRGTRESTGTVFPLPVGGITSVRPSRPQ